MSLSVCIISYRNPAYLDLCLKSATENKTLPDTQVLVILDGYASESEAVIQKYPGIDVVPLDDNVGQSRAHNIAVSMAENEYVLVINDDNVLGRYYDEHLSDIVNDECVFAPNQCEPSPSIFKSFHCIDFGRTSETFQYEAFLNWEAKYTAKITETRDGGTWPVLMQKKQWMVLGGIDCAFPHAPVADWDFFLRCELNGLELVRYQNTILYHFANKSESSQEKEQASFQYFFWKWGFNPGMDENNSHLPKGHTIRGVKY